MRIESYFAWFQLEVRLAGSDGIDHGTDIPVEVARRICGHQAGPSCVGNARGRRRFTVVSQLLEKKRAVFDPVYIGNRGSLRLPSAWEAAALPLSYTREPCPTSCRISHATRRGACHDRARSVNMAWLPLRDAPANPTEPN